MNISKGRIMIIIIKIIFIKYELSLLNSSGETLNKNKKYSLHHFIPWPFYMIPPPLNICYFNSELTTIINSRYLHNISKFINIITLFFS